MPDPHCNANVQANALFTSLVADAPIPPTLDLSDAIFSFSADENSGLYDPIIPISLDQLTTVDLEGTGVFDTLMQAMDLHIQREYKGNRITGDKYAEVYTQVATTVLGQSVGFLLQRDQSKWAAITAQMQARIAEIQATEALINLEKTKIDAQRAIFEMRNSGAAYALTKMQIANADAAYCLTLAQTDSEKYKRSWLMPMEYSTQEYNRKQMMPIEYEAKRVSANRLIPAEAALKEFQNRVLQPLEEGIQRFNLETTLVTQEAGAQFQLTQMLPVALAKEQHLLNFQLPAQTELINENIESERSKTLNTRTDGVTTITGSVGKQKDLYTQQIDSFIKDAQYKAGKMYLDGWITQKTLDEGLLAPAELGVASVSAVLASIRTSNGM